VITPKFSSIEKEYLGIDFFGLFTKFDPNIYVGGDNVIFWDH